MQFVRYDLEGRVRDGVLERDAGLIRPIDGPIWGDHTVADEAVPLAQVRLLAPVVPGKVIAIGLNYRKHAEEVGKPLPEEPMMFLVSPTAVIGPDETVALRYEEHRTEHEGELAVVIGRTAERVSVGEALDCVLGYTCCNDVSDRVLQRKDGQFTRAKSFAAYKPLGPVIETELDPDRADISVRVNGEIRQQSNTSDMIFDTASLVSFVSQVMRLDPGDVILTGTPSGVSPLRPGDRVEVRIEGIGSLVNMVSGAVEG